MFYKNKGYHIAQQKRRCKLEKLDNEEKYAKYKRHRIAEKLGVDDDAFFKWGGKWYAIKDKVRCLECLIEYDTLELNEELFQALINKGVAIELSKTANKQLATINDDLFNCNLKRKLYLL